MGKETKIGLAVIAALLIVFGVVVTMRIMNATTETAATDGASEAEGSTGEAAADDPNGETSTSAEAGRTATVITASAATSKQANRTGAAARDRWAIVSDEGDAAAAEDHSSEPTPAPTPPSFMPKPMTASSNPSYASSMADPSVAPQQSWQGAERSGQSDPFQRKGSNNSEPSSQYHSGSASDYRTYAANSGGTDQATAAPQSGSAYATLRPTDDSNAGDENPLRASAAGSSGDSPDTGTWNAGGDTNTPASGPLSQDRQTSAGYSSSASPHPTTDQYQSNPGSAADASASGSSYRRSGTSNSSTGGYSSAAASGAYASQAPMADAGNVHQRFDGPGGPQDDGTYVLQPNDSYWAVSEKLYGTGAYFQALAEYNAKRHPETKRLNVGDTILAPTKEELQEAYPELCPKPSHVLAARRRAMAASTTAGKFGGNRVYVVEEGDTLYDIARIELGRADRWVEIYQLNREMLGDDFDYLAPGTRLVLPNEAQPPSSVTNRPGTGYQR